MFSLFTHSSFLVTAESRRHETRGATPFMVDHVQLFLVHSPHQETPLHFAAREGREDIVRCLVDQGADPNIKNKRGVSEREYTADCKLVLFVLVGFHSPEQRLLLLNEL